MKKFFAFLLSMAMVLSMGFTTVFAGSNVAKFGETEYATLQAAIDAAELAGGGTITLLADYAENVTVEQAPGREITIDGAGKNMNGCSVYEIIII